MARSRTIRRTFGLLEERTSAVTGKVTSVRARYVGPDTEKHTRPFGDKMAAEAWLNAERILIDRGEWKPPKVRVREERLARQRAITLTEWAERSVANKKLRPSTRNRYQRALEHRILPELGDIPLKDVAPTDIDSAPVIGSPINNGRSWQYVDRYNYAECENYPYDCEIVATMDFRFTTDPGEMGTRTSLNIVRIGAELSTISLASGIYGDGVQYHFPNAETYGAGSWIHWNSPHLSVRNRTFQAWYGITVENPVGWDTAEYKTARSSDCGDATSGAFVCSFS